MTQIEELKTIIEHARTRYDSFLYWPHYYKQFPPTKCSYALQEKHKEKNHALHYAYPFDHNLIDSIPVYINASPMQFGSHKYIATQGPRFNTFADFWHMMWAEKSELVVSVTNEREEKGVGLKYKFDAFWPRDRAQEDYGPFTVSILEEKLLKKWSDGRLERIRLRQFEVQHEKEKRIVNQLHMENWMDGSIVYPESLIELSEVTDQWKGQGPIVVHCAAGIGRTGTFIAFHSLYHDLLNILNNHSHQFDILSRVEEMREKRYGPMIAERLQFLLLVEALEQALQKMAE